jgi:hypothetical protein
MLSLLLAQATDTYDYGTSAADAAATTAAASTGLAIWGGMVIFWLIFGALGLALFLWALIDVLRRQFTNPNDKILWIVLILFIGILGPILYLIIGRNKGTIPAPAAK